MEVVFQQGQVTLKLYLEAESNYVSGVGKIVARGRKFDLRLRRARAFLTTEAQTPR